MHVAQRLLADGHNVVGLDNLNAYYDPRFKEARIAQLKAFSNFQFEKIDIADRRSMAELFAAHRFPDVVHLAAQAGVRHVAISSTPRPPRSTVPTPVFLFVLPTMLIIR